MEGLTIFENKQFGQIRAVVHNNKPWLIGRDVAFALGYAKPENALATHIDKEDKTTTLIQGSGSNYKSKTVLINESGMYALIFGSKLETAKQFKHWVTSEVFPQFARREVIRQSPRMSFGRKISRYANRTRKFARHSFCTR